MNLGASRPPLLRHPFMLDLRSLALFRMGLGALTLYDLWDIFRDRAAFLGPQGLLPLAQLRHPLHWSLYKISDNASYVGFLFALHALAALCLLVGFRARAAAFVCWLMTVSLNNRLDFIIGGSDQVLQALLLWSIFLPTDSRLSVRPPRGDPHPGKTSYASLATAALVLQLVIIYVLNGIHQSDRSWTTDYTAVYYLLRNPFHRTPLADYLLPHASVLSHLTWVTRALELFGPLLLLVPLRTCLFRSVAIVSFGLLQVGILLTMSVGWSSEIMLVGWTALIPSCWWGRKPEEVAERPFLAAHRYRDTAVAAFLLLTILYNYSVSVFGHFGRGAVVKRLRRVGETCGITQRWAQFAPTPPTTFAAAYFVPLASDEDGDVTPLDGPVPIGTFAEATSRWRKYEANLLKGSLPPNSQERLVHYLVIRWNAKHPKGPGADTGVIQVGRWPL